MFSSKGDANWDKLNQPSENKKASLLSDMVQWFFTRKKTGPFAIVEGVKYDVKEYAPLVGYSYDAVSGSYQPIPNATVEQIKNK